MLCSQQTILYLRSKFENGPSIAPIEQKVDQEQIVYKLSFGTELRLKEKKLKSVYMLDIYSYRLRLITTCHQVTHARHSLTELRFHVKYCTSGFVCHDLIILS